MALIVQPLGQSRADQRRFVNRAGETEALIRGIAASQPVLVLGDGGSGRTSLLNHVAWLLARGEARRDSVLVSGEVAEDPAQLLGVLVARVHRLGGPRASRGRWLDDLRALSMPDGPFGAVARPAILMELIDLLGERLAELGRPVCLMVDGIAPPVAHGLFGTLRNELWTLAGATWVLAGDSVAEPRYLEPPADAFFQAVVRLGPLSDADARKLSRAHGFALTQAQLEQVLTAAHGNPRRLLRAAGEIQSGLAPSCAGTDELAARAARLAGPLAGALVEYLADRGPAAASDKTMLRRLGASRQRASQLMHELESAGLLETIEHHEPGRRGRPARRFAVRSQA